MTAPAIPAPKHRDPMSGAVVWDGGVVVLGPLLRIPGRQLDVDQLDEARAHAAAVLAACDHLEAVQRGCTGP